MGAIDEALAIVEVTDFLQMLRTMDQFSMSPQVTYSSPQYQQQSAAIHQTLPLIKVIAAECDPDLAERIDHGLNYGSGYPAAIGATNELLGILQQSEKQARIMGLAGPKLAFASMHRWIVGAAGNLWEDEHHEQAVTTAAAAIFDSHLPAKLGVPKDKPEALVARAFKDRLLAITEYTDPEDLTNAYQGAQYLGLACAKLVRNLRTHNVTVPEEESVLLEELALLSRFARIIDEAKAQPLSP